MKVVRIWSIQGNVKRNTAKIATTRGAKEKVWSCIEVKVCIRLMTTPMSIAAPSIGATIQSRVERAFCIKLIIIASDIIFSHHTFYQ